MMARQSLLNRSFSTREKVLILILAVLLVIACYYFLVVKNVADTLATNDTRITEVQEQIDQQTALAVARTKMEKELDALGDQDSLPQVAPYDNLRNELDELNGLLSSTTAYDLDFSPPERDDDLVRRAVSVSFTVPDYQTALNIVRSLAKGSYRCQITDFSLKGKMLADGSAQEVSAVLSVTYFETTQGATNLNGLVDKKG